LTPPPLFSSHAKHGKFVKQIIFIIYDENMKKEVVGSRRSQAMQSMANL